METKTPFDLTAAIQRWRDNLAQSPAFHPENLAELESHLRDSIARLQTTGLSADEAFMVAEKRIGRGGVLAAEYRKVNRNAIWLERFFWMLLGVQFNSLVVSTLCAIGRDALHFGLYQTNYHLPRGQSLISTMAFLVVANLALFGGGVAACWWLLRRRGETLGRWAAKLLNRRSSAQLTFCLILVLWYSIRNAGAIYLVLYAPVSGDAVTAAMVSTQIAAPIQTAALLGLTVYLAARRLRPVKA